MIIFTAGYPFSGKTFIVNEIISKLDDTPNSVIVNLSPKSFFDSAIESDEIKENDLTNTMRSEYMLSAWECSLEKLKEFIEDCTPNDLIIYDSGCASLSNMVTYFECAKNVGHRIIYLFVKCKSSVCIDRSNGTMNKSIMKSYSDKYTISIPALSKISDDVIIIENNVNNEIPDISKVMEIIDNGRIH